MGSGFLLDEKWTLPLNLFVKKDLDPATSPVHRLCSPARKAIWHCLNTRQKQVAYMHVVMEMLCILTHYSYLLCDMSTEQLLCNKLRRSILSPPNRAQNKNNLVSLDILRIPLCLSRKF